MFSGIVEAQAPILNITQSEFTTRFSISRPFIFDDISVGDSVCVDGTCLTVEEVSDAEICFCLGPETLRLTAWGHSSLQAGKLVNLERSLKLNSRVHGHFVTGHVDGVVEIVDIERAGDARWLSLRIPSHLKTYLWTKGSLCLGGVSLTINDVDKNIISVCLIPETLRKTNFASLQVGSKLNIEVDSMARAWVHLQKHSPKGVDLAYDS